MARISSHQASPPGVVSWPLVYSGVTVTTLATLLLGVSLTRLIPLSLPFLGLAAGGLLSTLFERWRERSWTKLGWLAGANSVVVLGAVVVVGHNGETGIVRFAVACLACTLPFVISGAILSLALSESTGRIARICLFERIGLAAGCLALMPLSAVFNDANLAIVVAMLFATSAAVWFSLLGRIGERATAVALGLILLGLLIYNVRQPVIGAPAAAGVVAVAALPVAALGVALLVGPIAGGRLALWHFFFLGAGYVTLLVAMFQALAPGQMLAGANPMTVVPLTALGFVMGMPFSASLAKLSGGNPRQLRGAWSMHVAGGAAGIASTVLLPNPTGAMLAGSLCYAVAWLWLRRKTTPLADIQ